MRICVIGAGIIGSAITRALLKRKERWEITATRRRTEKIADLKKLGATITADNREAAAGADIIILCVKPTNIKKVLNQIKDQVKGKLIISVAAAAPLKFIREIVPESRVIRAMPNIAVLVQEALTVYATEDKVSKEDKRLADEIFAQMGRYIEVEEKYMDALTGLSGSGPAYLSVIIEAMMYAGLKVGLPRDIALLASTQTMLGTAKLVSETKSPLSDLKDMVVTPAGVTIDGIYEIEGCGIRTAFMRAVEVATEKSRKITENIRNDNY